MIADALACGTKAALAGLAGFEVPGRWPPQHGSGPMVRDARTGKYRRTRLFVMMPRGGPGSQVTGAERLRGKLKVYNDPHTPAFEQSHGAGQVAGRSHENDASERVLIC